MMLVINLMTAMATCLKLNLNINYLPIKVLLSANYPHTIFFSEILLKYITYLNKATTADTPP